MLPVPSNQNNSSLQGCSCFSSRNKKCLKKFTVITGIVLIVIAFLAMLLLYFLSPTGITQNFTQNTNLIITLSLAFSAFVAGILGIILFAAYGEKCCKKLKTRYSPLPLATVNQNPLPQLPPPPVVRSSSIDSGISGNMYPPSSPLHPRPIPLSTSIDSGIDV